MQRLLLCIAALVFLGFPGFQPPADEPIDRFINARSPTLNLDASTATVEVQPLIHVLANDNAASTAVVDKSAGDTFTASANTSTMTVAGKINTALDFVPASTSVVSSTATCAATLGATTDPISICVWAYPDALSDNSRLLDCESSTTLLQITSAGKAYFQIGTAFSSTGTVGTGAWSHICALRRTAHDCDIYINGAFDSTGDCGHNNNGGATVMRIGNRAARDRTFDGRIDDLRIYNRALTPSEIAGIYNNATGHEYQAANKNASAITIDGSGNVASWQANGIEFYQSTAAARPAFTTLNGRRALSFDGTDDALASASISADSLAPSNAMTLIDVSQPTDGNGGQVFRGPAQYFVSSYRNTGTVHRFTTYNGSTSDALDLGTWGANMKFVRWYTHDGTVLRGAVNGGRGAWVSAINRADTTNASAIAYNGGTDYLAANVGSVIIYPKVLPESDLLTIERGLSRKWGVSLAGATAETSCDNYIRSLTPTLWLSAGDLSTITKDAGNLVSSWCSRVGSICFTQTTDANKPTWTGQGVDFDGSGAPNNDVLTTTATIDDLWNNNAATVFIVAKMLSNSRYILNGRNGATTYIAIYSPSANNLTFYNNDGAPDSISGTISDNVTFIFDGTHDTNLNMTISGTASSPVASGNTTDMAGVWYLGSRGDGAQPLDGQIITILADDSVWTADQRARVRSCLGQEQGVSF